VIRLLLDHFNALRNESIALRNESNALRNESFDWKEWKLVNIHDTPRQEDGLSCGVFVCLIVYLISFHLTIDFRQSHVDNFRNVMANDILKGK
jgi:Ulp1 family protease